MTYNDILRDIRAHRFAPIYLLMGDEPYFIDSLMTLIEREALSDDERDFNQTIFYGADTTPEQILDAARRYPMMAERQLVVVREAQLIKDGLDALVPYATEPNPSTILVLCYKHGSLDKRRRLMTTISKTGIVYESNRLWDNQLPPFVNDCVKARGCTIERSAVELLCTSVGADLSRIANEIDKLCLALPEGTTEISTALVAEQVGQSKDYNAFELVNAIAMHDAAKTMRIVAYFGTNPKGFALQPITATLFTFFSNLLLAYYAPERSETGIASFVGVNPTNVRRNILPAMSHYTGKKTLQIIRYLRRIDAKSKGVDCPNTSDYDLLRDLAYVILH